MSNTLPPDPYKVLGVSRGARLPEIRSAHRKLVLNCHPEKVQDAALKAIKQDEFQKVQQAYELLSDDTRRRQYDEQVKLFELKEDMGRGNPTSRSNPSEDEILMAEPRAPPYPSRTYTANHPPSPLFQDDGEELPRRSPVRKSMIDNEPGSHDSSSRIEEEIKARNAKVYENLKHAASGGKASANSDAKSKADEGTDTTKAAAKVMLTTVPPEQLGMKVMNPGTTKTSVDIIAVHGLGAIPEITWQEKHSGKNWLADTEMLPKAVPEARIMRFGYDSLWLGKEAIKTRLSTIANKLLLVLKREREVSSLFTFSSS
jgi:curved DNA-binding protein CbpA